MTEDISIRPMTGEDMTQVEALHKKAFGPGRFARAAYRVREDHTAAAPFVSPMCRVGILKGDIVAAVNMTDISVGGTNGAVLLGPLVVAPSCLGQNLGQPMVEAAIEAARQADRSLVLLVGDEPYYQRYGFQAVPTRQISFPGPVDPARILALTLAPGALEQFQGGIRPPHPSAA
jgi:predicted N-acetyltransferase YhbS